MPGWQRKSAGKSPGGLRCQKFPPGLSRWPAADCPISICPLTSSSSSCFSNPCGRNQVLRTPPIRFYGSKTRSREQISHSRRDHEDDGRFSGCCGIFIHGRIGPGYCWAARQASGQKSKGSASTTTFRENSQEKMATNKKVIKESCHLSDYLPRGSFGTVIRF